MHRYSSDKKNLKEIQYDKLFSLAIFHLKQALEDIIDLIFHISSSGFTLNWCESALMEFCLFQTFQFIYFQTSNVPFFF